MWSNSVLTITSDYSYKDECQQAALKRGYQLEYVKTMEEALKKLLAKDYALIVIRADTVDYLPLLTVMKQIQLIPILVFTYVEPIETEQALKMGADVYIVSPYSLDYIIESGYALIQLHANTIKQATDKQPKFLTHDGVRVCLDRRQVFVDGKEIEFAPNCE